MRRGAEFCPPYEIAYVATEPDLEITNALPALSFDLLRYTTAWNTSCGDYGSVIRTKVELASDVFADEEFVLLDVRAHHEATGITDVVR